MYDYEAQTKQRKKTIMFAAILSHESYFRSLIALWRGREVEGWGNVRIYNLQRQQHSSRVSVRTQ